MTLLSISILALSLLYSSGHANGNQEPVNNQVLLFTVYNLQQPFCAGTVIGDKYVLTAAHCVVDKNSHEIETNQIVVGNLTNNILSMENGVPTFNFAKEIIVHKNYTEAVKGYDIAILQLNPGFNADSGIQKLELPSTETYDNVKPKVTTFTAYNPDLQTGDTHLVTLTPTDLRYEEVQLEDSIECRELYKGDFDSNLQMCNSVKRNCSEPPYCNRYDCDRDGGSGLVYEGKAIGLTSWSTKCYKDVDQRPTVYTRVSAFADWIRKVMAGERDPALMRTQTYKDLKFESPNDDDDEDDEDDGESTEN